MATATSTVPPDARTHREEFVAYVLGKAKAWHREQMGRLYGEWADWNERHFSGRLTVPYLLLTSPTSPRALGDYGKVSCFGGYGQICIRPTLLTGKHRCLRAGAEFAEGRFRFVADVFLHESVHQHCDEVLGNLELSYKGHGPVFAGECNRIGSALGLPPVRPAKARGPNKDLPSCAYWPHNVRPDGYYLGAYVPAGATDSGVEKDDGEQDEPDSLGEAIRGLFRAAVRFGSLLPPNNMEALDTLRRRGALPGPGIQTLKAFAILAGAVYLDFQAGKVSEESTGDSALVPVVSADRDDREGLLGPLALLGVSLNGRGSNSHEDA
jgi:hypothetical protein